uniref:TryptophantRNA ligase n=1 Tax=Rhizophora mucronata TaxID=61149 RepID=A0A2P2LNR9_RHIMU
MKVYYKEKSIILILKSNPILYGTQIIAKVD